MNSNETNQPLISVIVPVYNIIPYLPRCVESLQKQTYPELEILLIDDGSTDDTPVLCDRLAENDPRIRVFHKENGGPSSARNFGLTQAAGAYVGFVDSDDYVDADMYERLYRRSRLHICPLPRQAEMRSIRTATSCRTSVSRYPKNR